MYLWPYFRANEGELGSLATNVRAYYHDTIPNFLRANQGQILGELTSGHHFDLDILQKNSWVEEIALFKRHLQDIVDGDIFFEFSIPRMGSRVDVLLLIGGVIFVVECKVGADSYESHAIDQVTDYSLDLKNFHEGSHDKYIAPILMSTKAASQNANVIWSSDKVAEPLTSNGQNLTEIVRRVLSRIPPQQRIDANSWTSAGYKPTPTIVEAAKALYQKHSVESISRSDAGATNLTQTSNCISEIIKTSKENRRKSICFVTGVPGAGKTLAGLNISTQKLNVAEDEYAVFLSGNGPLVEVLREALARDEVKRAKEGGQKLPKKLAASRVGAFIQNIHHFRDEALVSAAAQPEHVVVFDEAQRAWDQTHAEKFMRQKRARPDFSMSEPEFLISVMNRNDDWACIVCLLGGGQEINTGEGGLTEWFDALQKSFSDWDVYCSPHVTEKVYSRGQDLGEQLVSLRAHQSEALHLSVSIRSFRTEKLSAFVGALIDGDAEVAATIYSEIQQAYPIALTRDLERTRKWLRQRARGSERTGLIASSGALRLKSEGINVKVDLDPITWFLNGKNDVRSSYYLEDVATEFHIQGLELDWAGICWDADFRRLENAWVSRAFKGTRWQDVHDASRRMYLANAYRVLLTRARQGMVVFVPKGDERDPTRPPSFYDETFNFLSACGIKTV
jgi:hypothetical protein